MKTGLANLTFCAIFHNFFLSNISLFTVLLTADFGFSVCLFFFAAFWLRICVEMDVEMDQLYCVPRQRETLHPGTCIRRV